MISSFIIKIKDGKLAFKGEHHKAMFDRYMRQFDEEKEYRLEIVEKQDKRSEQQNRYYWLYLSMISEQTGYTKLEVHEWAKGKFLTSDIKEIFGDKTRVKKSTKELRVGEFQEYLINISVETGIELPDTTAYFGYSYHK